MLPFEKVKLDVVFPTLPLFNSTVSALWFKICARGSVGTADPAGTVPL